LRVLELCYCDHVSDELLSEIIAVCRTTLTIQGYFGEPIEAKWKLDSDAIYGLPEFS